MDSEATEGTQVQSPYDPQWTEREYDPGGSRDDLGIETLGESILSDLLPGINNQTRRARYYSFWAWVLRDFINDPDTKHTQTNLYTWLRRREAALIFANLSHDCGGGAAGTTIGGQRWQDGRKDSYDLDWKSLLSVSGGAYQLYYRGALQETNVIVIDDESPHDDLTESVGLRLADAYANAVSESRYVRKYLDADNLRKSDIEDFAEYGCLCQSCRSGEETKALIDTFFRFDTPDVYAVKRLASLSLFLDIIDQSQGQPLDEDSFRAVLYFWGYGDHHDYVPEGNLLEPAQRWRIFQLRQYFVYAIESFWSLFLHRIQIEALSEAEYLNWLIDNLDLPALIEELSLPLAPSNLDTVSIKDFFQAIRSSLPKKALEPGTIGQSTTLNEQEMKDVIQEERSRSDVTIHAGCGLILLALMYWRSAAWRELPGFHYVSSPFAADRLPFDSFMDHIDHAFKEDWSVATWLAWFHQRYLWLQHRRVTLTKLASRNQETAKFGLEYQEEANIPRFRGLDLDFPKMNAPRFPSALTIFLDLDLIEEDGEGYKLCPDGKNLLEMFRKYRVPAWEEPEEEYEASLDLEESTSG